MSKCNWYKNGERSTKFFMNLEKYCADQDCPCIIMPKQKGTKQFSTNK